MTFKTFIKSHDMFGHQIGLKLQGKDTYSTFIGGLFSMIISSVIYLYMIRNLITMFTPGAGDYLSTVIENINVDDLGKVKLADT